MRGTRRLKHHALIALGAVLLGASVAWVFAAAGPRARISAALAYIGLAGVALSLAIGPLNIRRGRPNPVSGDLRRDLGLWGGIAGLLHVGIGLTVHLRGHMEQYFVPRPGPDSRLPLRIDPFGWANHLGLLAGAILLVLVLLSSDVALRRLGAARWKRWQRLNYIGALAILGHGALYQIIEKRKAVLVALFALLVIATVVIQGLGMRAVRARSLAARS